MLSTVFRGAVTKRYIRVTSYTVILTTTYLGYQNNPSPDVHW